jgi:AcrR family transcriptional regulator
VKTPSNAAPTTGLRSTPGRLDADAWIKAAIAQLARDGIDGVRIELLARQLNVTKGSFYAHFRDREELRVAILQYWRSRATLALIDRLNQRGGSARERLEQLISLVISSKSRWGDDAELSIRLWARQDGRARATLAEVDELRVRYITNILTEGGLGPDSARAHALLVYAFMRVAPSLGTVAAREDLALAQRFLVDNLPDV